MRRVLILIFIYSGMSWAQALPVKVRLKKNISQAQLRGLGLKDPFRKAVLTSTHRYEKLDVALKKIGRHQSYWELNWDNQKYQRLIRPQIEVSADLLHFYTQLIPRKIHLIAKNNQFFDVVSKLPLESYLMGVLPSEMPAAWPLEALKAQLVAIRSYTVSMMKRRSKQHYHLDSTIDDQVFELANHVRVDLDVKKKLDQVLNTTAGEVLVDQSEQPLMAYYHADCGGKTEDPHNVWNNGVFIGMVEESYCPQSPHGRWVHSIRKEYLQKKLREHFELIRQKLIHIEVEQKTSSGRIKSILVAFNDESVYSLTAQNFRRLLGFKKVKSTNFKLSFNGQVLKLQGRGFGHGVGLCQWGSRYLALKGWDYKRILRHYYPKAKLKSNINWLRPKQLAQKRTSRQRL